MIVSCDILPVCCAKGQQPVIGTIGYSKGGNQHPIQPGGGLSANQIRDDKVLASLHDQAYVLCMLWSRPQAHLSSHLHPSS